MPDAEQALRLSMYAAMRGRSDRPSPATIARVHATVRASLNAALIRRHIAFNPALQVELERVERRRMPVWTIQELKAFLALQTNDPWHPALCMIALTGLRRGEALRLTWEDVDLANARLRVLTAKTDAGVRVITLADDTVRRLRALRKSQLSDALAFGSAYAAGNRVLCWPDGSAPDPEVLNRHFHQLAKGAGLPRIRLHDLRHTHASHALAAGGRRRWSGAEWAGAVEMGCTSFPHWTHRTLSEQHGGARRSCPFYRSVASALARRRLMAAVRPLVHALPALALPCSRTLMRQAWPRGAHPGSRRRARPSRQIVLLRYRCRWPGRMDCLLSVTRPGAPTALEQSGILSRLVAEVMAAPFMNCRKKAETFSAPGFGVHGLAELAFGGAGAVAAGDEALDRHRLTVGRKRDPESPYGEPLRLWLLAQYDRPDRVGLAARPVLESPCWAVKPGHG